MAETRRLKIVRKRFSPCDIRALFQVLQNQANRSRKDGSRYITISVQLECTDGTEYESGTPVHLGKGAAIDTKRVESIHLSYRDGDKNRNINVRLLHGEIDGKVSVRSDDNAEEWTKATHTEIRELIDSISPSDSWFTRHSTVLFCILACALIAVVGLVTYTWWILEARFLPDVPQPTDGDSGYWSSKLDLSFQIRFGIWTLIALSTADSIRNWILKAWPNVDLDMGPSHLRSERLRRSRIALFTTAVAVPFIWLVVSLFLR